MALIIWDRRPLAVPSFVILARASSERNRIPSDKKKKRLHLHRAVALRICILRPRADQNLLRATYPWPQHQLLVVVEHIGHGISAWNGAGEVGEDDSHGIDALIPKSFLNALGQLT